jgi:hypothetical protein
LTPEEERIIDAPFPLARQPHLSGRASLFILVVWVSACILVKVVRLSPASEPRHANEAQFLPKSEPTSSHASTEQMPIRILAPAFDTTAAGFDASANLAWSKVVADTWRTDAELIEIDLEEVNGLGLTPLDRMPLATYSYTSPSCRAESTFMQKKCNLQIIVNAIDDVRTLLKSLDAPTWDSIPTQQCSISNIFSYAKQNNRLVPSMRYRATLRSDTKYGLTWVIGNSVASPYLKPLYVSTTVCNKLKPAL